MAQLTLIISLTDTMDKPSVKRLGMFEQHGLWSRRRTKRKRRARGRCEEMLLYLNFFGKGASVDQVSL